MMLIAASCPSNNDAAVTIRTLLTGLYGSTFSIVAITLLIVREITKMTTKNKPITQNNNTPFPLQTSATTFEISDSFK